jgi:polyferredoxin
MRARRYSQVSALVVGNAWFAYLVNRTIFRGVPKGVCYPGMNCYACPLAMYSCPIGALQHSLAVRSFGAFAYVIGTLGLIGALFGRLACGWICPFGLLQELLYKVPLPKLKLPSWAGYLKYVALGVLAVLLPLLVREHWYSRLCPVGTLEGAIPLQALPPAGVSRSVLEPGVFFWLKIGILVVFLLWMTVTRRPFCRTACPLGAFWSFFNPVSLYRMGIDPEKCTMCGKCREVCPVDINVYEKPNAPECVRCLDCKKACPYGAVTSGFLLSRGQSPTLENTVEL